MESYLRLQNISKSFHGVKALDNVSVDFNKSEIHVVIGENGAGKSTLMKIAAGLYKRDSGRVILDGKDVDFNNPLDAIANGVSMIHQELLPIPYLTVAENIFLGREPLNPLGLLDKKQLYSKTEKLLKEINIEIDPYKEMRMLSVAQKQLVEIAKAVSFNSKILIMDEPTSAISDKEVEKLYDLIFKLKSEGVALIFISHKLDEIFKVADKITVLRDGQYIGTKNASDLTRDSLISMMIGRELTNIFEKEKIDIGEKILEVKNLTRGGEFENVSFSLHKNEILGISGLMGAGRTEVVEAIFGLRKLDSGEVFIKGNQVSIKCATDAQNNGIALIPEDRKQRGLNLKDSTGFNISLCDLKRLCNYDVIDKKRENKEVLEKIKELNVKVKSPKSEVVSLSGGNQQKVVLAKWLMTTPEILIMDEPTRGIDIGAKTEIYKLIVNLAKAGKSIIMVSSELPEIIGLSDRVIVLCEGQVTGELSGEDINQKEIMKYATNSNLEQNSDNGRVLSGSR